MLARGAGMVGRRYFPQVMRSAYRTYSQNPGMYNRGLARAVNAGKQYGAKGLKVIAAGGAGYAGGELMKAGSSSSAAPPNYKRRLSTPYELPRKIARYNARGGGRGQYAGLLPKGKKKNLKKQSMSKFSTKGATTVRETVGSVQDSDSVYLYFHKFAPSDLIYNISKALIRKICEMAFKVSYTSFDNFVLGGNYSPILGAYKIVITTVNPVTGGDSATVLSIAASTTLTNLAGSGGLLPVLNAYSSGYGEVSANNPKELFLMSLYKTINSDADSILLATLNLQDEVCQIHSTVEVKIQNRSQSASGSSATDVVDSNPLQGYIYEFGSIPKTRDVFKVTSGSSAGSDRASKFGSIKFENGINLIRGSQLPSAYLEPISAKSFRNCKGVTKIRLEPGNIKNCFRSFTKSCNVLRFLTDFNMQTDSATLADARIIKTLGGGVMLSLEDMINVNATSQITVTYEAEHRIGCRLKTRKGAVMVGDFTESTYDNIPA